MNARTVSMVTCCLHQRGPFIVLTTLPTLLPLQQLPTEQSAVTSLGACPKTASVACTCLTTTVSWGTTMAWRRAPACKACQVLACTTTRTTAAMAPRAWRTCSSIHGMGHQGQVAPPPRGSGACRCSMGSMRQGITEGLARWGGVAAAACTSTAAWARAGAQRAWERMASLRRSMGMPAALAPAVIASMAGRPAATALLVGRAQGVTASAGVPDKHCHALPAALLVFSRLFRFTCE